MNGREMRTSITQVLLMGVLLFQSTLLWGAEDLSVIDVRRNIPLSDTDPIYKDFYIYHPAAASVQTNLVVEVYRKLLFKDPTGVEALGDLEVPVGKLKIIAKSKNILVAREWELLSREEYPMLDQTGILVGDRLDLTKSFPAISTNEKKMKSKKQ